MKLTDLLTEVIALSKSKYELLKFEAADEDVLIHVMKQDDDTNDLVFNRVVIMQPGANYNSNYLIGSMESFVIKKAGEQNDAAYGKFGWTGDDVRTISAVYNFEKKQVIAVFELIDTHWKFGKAAKHPKERPSPFKHAGDVSLENKPWIVTASASSSSKRCKFQAEAGRRSKQANELDLLYIIKAFS